MPCLFALVAAAFPRIGTILLWIARPMMVNAAFNNRWLIPIAGIIFLPFTTLMYVILWNPIGALSGWDWFWLVLAVIIDISHWSSTAYYNRNRIPGYTGTPSNV
jgi:hypothetical protein